MSRAVVLTGGADYAHDFTSTGPELAAIANEVGFTPVIVQHPDDLVEILTPTVLARTSSSPGSSRSHRSSSDRSDEAERVDVLIVNALRWRMLADRHAEWRDTWAYTTNPETRRVIENFVASGGGLVGNHTAPICFDDWPEWGDVLGGAWDWERSAHPPLGPIQAHLTGSHPITAGVSSPLDLEDEVYGDMNLRPGVQVLATAKRTTEDRDQPMIWTHTYGSGRVAYCCFGHDTRSLRHSGVRRILHQSIRWAARQS